MADQTAYGSMIADSAGTVTSVLSSLMSMGNILVVVIFSLVGLAAFRYGKKNGEARTMVLGAALMVYGYFVSNAMISLLVGSVLTALIFFRR